MEASTKTYTYISYANLDFAVESCQDDAVQKQDAIQDITDLRLCKSR